MSAASSSMGLIYLVEDDPDLSRSLEWMLRGVGYEVRAFGAGREFQEQFDPATPSCVILDLLLPGMTGLKIHRELAAARAHCACVMISGHGDVTSAVEAMRLGAVDFLEKPCSRQKLLDAVQRGLDLAQRRWRETIEEDAALARLGSLSAREREVFERMAAGRTTREIAAGLGIRPKTVDVHRSNVARKLEIKSSSQLGHLLSLLQRRRDRLEE